MYKLKLYAKNLNIVFLLIILLSILFLSCLNTVSAAHNDTIYVSADGNDDNDGLNWINAKKTLKNATLTINVNGTIYLDEGQYGGENNTKLIINKSMTIIGKGTSKTNINGNNINWAFYITNNTRVNIYNLTINNCQRDSGGAIYNNGTLKIENTILTKNKAVDGNDYFWNGGSGSDGGAIYNNGKLSVINSVFNYNQAGNGGNGRLGKAGNGGNGGAIYNNGELSLINSIMTNNQAGNGGFGTSLGKAGNGGDGGAIYNHGNMTIKYSIINQNSAGETGYGIYGGKSGDGGAIYNIGNLNISSSTLNCNQAGTGINEIAGGDGGAIYNKGKLSIINSVLNNNQAGKGSNGGNGGDGGAIYNNGDLKIVSTNLSHNNAGKGGSKKNSGSAGHGGDGGAIYNNREMVLTGVSLNNNQAGDGGDGGKEPLYLVNAKNGNGGCGGAIYNNGKIQIYNASLTNNRAGNPGQNGPGGTGGRGGAICNYGEIVIKNCVLLENTAIYGGAAYNAGSGFINIEKCELSKNSAVLSGGAICNYAEFCISQSRLRNNTAKKEYGGAIYNNYLFIMYFCSILNNNDSQGYNIYNKYYLYAQDNWWGSNKPEISKIINNAKGTTKCSRWLYLTAISPNTSIKCRQNASIVVSFNNIYDGKNITPLNSTIEYVFDDTPIKFTKSSFGNYNPIIPTISRGESIITFSSEKPGISISSIEIYDLKEYFTFKIEKSNTNITNLSLINSFYGEDITISAELKDEFYKGLPGQLVIFKISNSNIVTAITDNNGRATIKYHLNMKPGHYVLEAIFNGTESYNENETTSNLIINPARTSIIIDNITAQRGQKVIIKATLKDQFNKPVPMEKITFLLNNTIIGTGLTDNNGIAVLKYKITQKIGKYSIIAIYHGNENYTSVNNTGTLKVPQADLYIPIINPKNHKLVELFTVTYKLGNQKMDNSEKVTIKIKLPKKFLPGKINGDGEWTYNKKTNIINWIINIESLLGAEDNVALKD